MGTARAAAAPCRTGSIAVVAVAALYLLAVGPSAIPVDWITILTHGLERKNIMHLYAQGSNSGANFAFISAVVGGASPNLHRIVWLNLLLGLVNAVIFLHVAASLTGPRWAIPWTLAFALNPALFFAAFSELPTNLLTLYFLIGVIAWAVLTDPLEQSRAVRAAACGLAALVTFFAALTRIEVALIGTLALALYAAQLLFRPQWWVAIGQRLRSAGAWALAYFGDHLGVLAILCVIGVFFSKTGLPIVLGRSEFAGLYPFNPSIFTLFIYLPMLFLPVAVSLATLFGFVHAFVHFRRYGGIALSLFVLSRTYLAAESQYFEMGRYLSYALPAIYVLALIGHSVLQEATRRWPPNWGRTARIVYVMAWFTIPPPGISEFYARPEYSREGGFAQFLLDRDTQREVRHLVALTAAYPECVFVARVVNDYFGNFMAAPQYVYMIFGATVSQPISVPEAEMSLDEVVRRHASGASCVRLYAGGDCNLTFTDRCAQFVAGRRLLESERFWSRPFSDPLEVGHGDAEIVLSTYEWP